jgi:hypothetical protein
MMVVTVEIWPGGKADASYEIARMEVSNISGLAAVSNYSARVTQRATVDLGVQNLDIRASVDGHLRSRGPWFLIARVLQRVFPTNPD